MFGLQHHPNKLMLDAESLKLANNFYDDSHGKKIVPLQDLEKIVIILS